MKTAPSLEALVQQVRACRICRDMPLGAPLPHEPRPVLRASATARMLIAGQAPGTKVHASGLPFDDRSGDRLREWLGVTREEFYDTGLFAIVPMGFCFPGQDAHGGDLPPRRECAPAWRLPLMQSMPQIDLMFVIGGYAQAWHMPDSRRAGMTQTVARWREILAGSQQPRVLPLPHPSWRNTGWLKRHDWFEAELVPELRRLVRRQIDAS